MLEAVGKIEAWALELKGWEGRGRKKAWGKKMDLYPLIYAVNIKRPPQALKLACSQGVVRMARLDYPNP